MTQQMTPPASQDVRPFWGNFTAHGSGVALASAEASLSWPELDRQVKDRADIFAGARRLVMLSGSNTIDFVVNYLAALSAHCPVLVVTPGSEAAMAAVWNPDIVVDADQDLIDVRRSETTHVLHPDLALLLSTSGSTGSPKLVRLSHDNLLSNADSIADYLALTGDDCGITSLPLHYCYGLSVLHSHLQAGAPVAITDDSVIDSGFWDLAKRCGVTGLAGVPHTFDLLESQRQVGLGLVDSGLPRLRYLTQAGGRLEPHQVRAWHGRGVQSGWDFFVMYGQTEATARIAYLPPDLAAAHPNSIGHAVPGGSLELAPVEEVDDGVGELVYSGSNVMMGYAEQPADLGLDPMPQVLHTGDLARQLPGGLFEVVGRLKRITKVFGLRINLDDVERHLASAGIESRVVGTQDGLTVFLEGSPRRGQVEKSRHLAAAACDVPVWVVNVEVVQGFAVTASGKPDYAGLEALSAERLPDHGGRLRAATGTKVDAEDLRTLYARILDRPDATVDDSFVDLGADSLSYVEMSVQLGARINPLPADWHERSIRLLATSGTTRRWGRGLDSNVVLRALAITLVVGAHSDLWKWQGGAHLLLALAGFNFARFHLGTGGGEAPWRRVVRAVAAVALPASLWIAVVALITREYTLSTIVYLNWAFGSSTWDERWRFWFLEALIWALALCAALFAIRRVRAFETRHPFAVALTAVAGTLILRWSVVGVSTEGVEEYTVLPVLWIFALGWLVARSTIWWQRGVTSLIVFLGLLGFFADLDRELVVIGGLLIALWVSQVRVPRLVASALGAVAAASLAIYVTHWQIYPHLERDHQLLAVFASLAVGLAYHHLTRPLVALTRGQARRRAQDVPFAV